MPVFNHCVDLVARHRHGRVVGGGADGEFGEGAIIEVETGAAGSFTGINSIDHNSILCSLAAVTAVTEGSIGHLVADRRSANVQRLVGHSRRQSEDRPHVATIGKFVQLLEIKASLHGHVLWIHQRCFAGHHDGLLLGRGRHGGVDGVRESQGYVHLLPVAV